MNINVIRRPDEGRFAEVGAARKKWVEGLEVGIVRVVVTSGDDNPNNSDLQTFNPLFPRGAYFGEPALIGPANHIDVHPQLEVALRRNLSLTLDWDCFWRENTHDGIYGPAVNLIQSGRSSDARYVGNQAEGMLEWRFDRHFTL